MAVVFFDFDSTVVKKETLDDAIATALAEHPEKERLVREIDNITRLGMEGKLSFLDSVTRRLQFVPLSKKLLEDSGRRMLNEITPGMEDIFSWLSEAGHGVHIVSGGFLELIAPVAKKLGVPDADVHSNKFIFDSAGNVVATDTASLLWTNDGKTPVLRALRAEYPEERFVMIGDGINDYKAFESGAADDFFGFGANVVRESVKAKALHFFYSGVELLTFMQKELQ